MFQQATVMIGQYRPLVSFMHSLDARAKVLPILLVLILLLLTNSWLFSISMLILIACSLYFAGVDKKICQENLKPILYFILFTAGYHLLFSGKETEPLFRLFSFSLYKGAIISAGYYSLRLVLFLSTAFLITLTCSPSQLSEAITKLLRPLKIVKFPLSDFSLLLFISLRFIPILYDEYQTVKNAQQMRGVKYTGSFIKKILNLKSLLIPLLLSAIRRADELADALQARGYDSNKERTFFTTDSFSYRDTSFLILSLVTISLLFYWVG